MNYTTNFGLKQPQRGVDAANVGDLNDNAEDIDTIMYQNRTMLAPPFDPSETYNEGNRVVQLGEYYICNTDNTTGPWDATYWDKSTIGEDLEANAGGGGGGGSSHEYSETEHIVGTWIDGSTVYEKTISVGTITSPNTTVQHNISNFGMLIDITGVCSMNGGSVWQRLGQYNSSGLYSYFSDCSSSSFILYVGSDIRTYYPYNCYVTMRYTKSS